MMRQKTRNDVILIVVLLIISAICFGGIKIYQKLSTENATAVIRVNGEMVGSYLLNEDTEVMVDAGNGNYNLLSIKDGHVKMQKASCPDKICVQHAKISKNGETIVCLPNKVVIEIMNGEETGVDLSTN